MSKVLVCGRGGSGKSTLVALLAQQLGKAGRVLVVDADESNLGLGLMLGLTPPGKTLMDYLGGRPAVREKLMAAIQGQGNESLRIFAEEITFDSLPAACVAWNGPIGFLRVGKIERAMEGCACPMGAVGRDFLNHLKVKGGEWVLVDTEAGVEHFGRGVLEGADTVLMVVDPSRDAVILAEKAARLAEEAGKSFGVVLNKVDAETEPTLREALAARGITEVKASLSYSRDIARAGLSGSPLDAGPLAAELRALEEKLGL